MADTHTGSLQELGGLGNANVRIVGADVDRNGNIVVANFAAGEVSLLARMDDLAAGLFVQIERVISDRFPEITVELRVQDRRRRPVVGLEARNFILSESGRPVAGQEFLGAAYLSKRSDISILIERSLETRPLLKDLETAVRDASSAADRVLALVSAGEQPIKENIGSGAELLQAARSRTPSYTPRWNFDLGLRLAATELLAGEKKRAVVFISSGKLGEKSFERYGLSELASYLANNGIVFYTVVLSDTAVDKELRYLCEQTGGQVLSLYRNEGIAPVIAALREGPSGSYALKYSSKLPTDFGRAYLGLEAEAYLMERSGRDALGYFPPLE
ncbi:hypothetical protein MASR2M78_01190 [Treponema sp.]